MRDNFLMTLSIIILAAVTITIFSGSEPGYIRTYYPSTSQLSENRFCLEFSQGINGTVEYKKNIYRDCIGD